MDLARTLPRIHDANLPLLVLTSSLVAILVSQLLSRGVGSDATDPDGCQPAAKLWQWDPFMGFDTVIGQIRALKNDYYLDWLRKLHAGRAKTFSLRFFGGRWFYSSEPEILKAVYATSFQDFGVEPIRRNSRITMPFADKGVNTTDGEDWHFSRQLIKPFFERDVYHNTDRVKPFADDFLALFPTSDGETFDVQPLLQRWFLDLNTDFIFGESVGALQDPARAKFAANMVTALKGARLRAQTYRFIWAFSWKWWLDAVGEIHDFVNAHILSTFAQLDEREAQLASGTDVAPERTDLLWTMAQQMRGDLEGLRSQLCLIIVPTNDTTSILIANCIWYLARNPDAWQKLRAEVAALGPAAPLSFDVLRNMPFLNGVLNETHRLIPNNVTQVRACIADTVLPLGGGPGGKGPLRVRKGDVVSVTKTVMYRDPDLWGPDAEEYHPERWQGVRGSWAFLPYGGGPRRCPAQMMVQTEAAYMLARLAREYSRLEARDPDPYRATMRIGPSNRNGVRIAVFR
ncbi:putative cytochrome P450 monooxygenase [Microdochium bolleyi]|uniref:Putative cytochrome P450 monooxygenase n=1 Tax=Microdochium bolleyi TaxID=196109 RepID=A0A136ISX5_9PEZI|nr:putative cytochrome P450 monooxygenase [Microdochium bolleyi]